jgi:hypothetical protein
MSCISHEKPADLMADGIRFAREHGLDQAPPPPFLRKLRVTVEIEGQSTDASDLAPLVDEALREFLALSMPQDGALQGKFESKAGLDVTWRAMNAYYQHGQCIGVIGVDSSGRPIDTVSGRGR